MRWKNNIYIFQKKICIVFTLSDWPPEPWDPVPSGIHRRARGVLSPNPVPPLCLPHCFDPYKAGLWLLELQVQGAAAVAGASNALNCLVELEEFFLVLCLFFFFLIFFIYTAGLEWPGPGGRCCGWCEGYLKSNRRETQSKLVILNSGIEE